jgi:hypothetical protein
LKKKRQPTVESERTEALAEAKRLLSEHYDCGFTIVSWEQAGETMHGEFVFGNKYAVEGLAGDSFSILFPDLEEEVPVAWRLDHASRHRRSNNCAYGRAGPCSRIDSASVVARRLKTHQQEEWQHDSHTAIAVTPRYSARD